MNTQFTEVDGHHIAYHRKGHGAPVLLVHGVASHSFLWDGIAELLAEKFDVIAIDLLGCGESDKPLDVDYSIAAQAEILMKFIDKLKLAPLHLVGHDLGGGIVQIMAVTRPEQLIDLTLINPVGYDYWPVQPITLMRLPVIRSLTASIMNPHMLRMVIRRALFYKERLTDDLMGKFWEPLQSQAGRDGFVRLIKAINNRLLTDITGQLRQLKLSSLVIRGDADAYLSREITEKLAEDIPNARLAHITTGGHFIQLDEPEQLFKLLSDFFLEEKEL
ncbi:MAG: alpha/beta hydrolase [Chromatiales bacterium]|nr:alpha/beta hydrolase [Chromatiales bacterium]